MRTSDSRACVRRYVPVHLTVVRAVSAGAAVAVQPDAHGTCNGRDGTGAWERDWTWRDYFVSVQSARMAVG